MSGEVHRSVMRALVWLLGTVAVSFPAAGEGAPLRCGAAAIDVTPRHLPVIRNGGFLQATDDRISDPLHARCVVIDDGTNRIAIVVVDSCMIPLSLCDEAKSLAARATGISEDHIMVSATHTHMAPSVMNYCLGSGIDQKYRDFLPGKIAEAIEAASERLQPARVGWARIDASDFTKCRRWITRTDKLLQDPFGQLTVHANMHPGHLNPDFVGPSGPIDPWLSLLLVTDKADNPIAAIANFSMHYYSGHSGVSADYFGRYANKLAARLAAENPNFVGIMSQGTSGDLWWGDYARSKEEKPFNHIDEFTDGLVKLSIKAIDEIEMHDEVPVRLAEKRITLPRRVPNEERLAWARRKNQLRGDRLPRDRPEVYALQAEYMHQNRTDDVVLQAIRIGDLGITGIPNEVYALTGLKLKRRSPLELTFNVSLANGACGYIPPPEQHALGGYTTWPARTAGLDETAEPKIVDALLELLEVVAGQPRKEYEEAKTPFSEFVIQSKPYAYWRLAEMERIDAADASGNGRSLRCSGLVAYHLPGKSGPQFGSVHNSHALQLAGGKLVADKLNLGESYSIQLSFYLGTPTNFRDVTAVLFARGADELFITGRGSKAPGRLAFGKNIGRTTIQRDQWHQLVFVRNGDFVQVFLNGNDEPEISAKVARASQHDGLVLGGNLPNSSNFEGKLDEVCVYDRALTSDEVVDLFQAAGFNVGLREPTELQSEPKDVESSLDCIHIRDGYEVELVAAEPMVMDPVAIDWGLDGTLWVAEMADYPMGVDGNGKPGGRIRRLVDSDGDGRYDTSTTFLEGIGFPNGVMVWGSGVLVTAAPQIFYAEDTNGDGSANVRETLLNGFLAGNQQLRVNGLRWGLDNLVHCASGAHHANFGAGNSIFSTKQNESIQLGSRDFRFDPNTGQLDPQSGPSQYGRVRDDFGNWFGVQNSQPLWHYVLEDHYVRRNTAVPNIDPRQQVRVPRMPEVYSAKPPQRRFHGFDHAGHYTSACGISIYRDEFLFPREELHAFTCEPFHNLVQHHVLTEQGTSFRGERADDGPIDFFASTDRWTRPVMTRTGPDGALWIVDMYRYMIEHPEWLPQQGKDALRPGYRAGERYGRIYRVVPANQPAKPIPKMGTTSTLTKFLTDPNGVVRDLAHRSVLLQGIGAADASKLRELALRGEMAETRVQALSTLDGLGLCDAPLIEQACHDDHPGVRRCAVRIAERLHDRDAALECVLSLVDDAHAKVRMQVATSLGAFAGKAAAEALVKLALRAEGDAFIEASIISSLSGNYKSFVDLALLRFEEMPSSILDALLLTGETHATELARLLSVLLANGPEHFEVRCAGVARWLDSLESQSITLADLAKRHSELVQAADDFSVLAAQARSLAQNTSTATSIRREAVGLLGRDTPHASDDIAILCRIMSTAEPKSLQSSAMDRLSRISHESVFSSLIRIWRHLLPQLRERATSVMLSRTSWKLQLLDAIATGQVDATDLSLAQRQSLVASPNAAIASRAKEVLNDPVDANRHDVVDRYSANLRVGVGARGHRVFVDNCQVCHTLDRSKAPVGPDLRSLSNRSTDILLRSILAPSETIEPRFQNYTILLKSGEALVGIVADEGASSVTIVDEKGVARTLLRNSIEEIQRSSKSLMPDGFESKISPTQMADLIAYLQEI